MDSFKRTRFTSFYTYLAMSSVFCLPPILFLTFRESYGISYTLLGTLVAVNFCTQLAVDLIFSFLAAKFSIKLVLRIMPLLTSLGLTIYALVPAFFPNYAYIGLLLGTVIFSIASGISEVLMSAVVAALPSDNPSRDMSTLHSLYAYGVLTVATVSTAVLYLFGSKSWIILTLFWAALPIISCVLFCISPLPQMNIGGEREVGTKSKMSGLALCAVCIFLGSAAENSMINWISVYIEKTLNIPKAVGDVLGLALFAVLLGMARTLYAKYGKNIMPILLWGMIGAAVCYIVAGTVSNVIVSMVACVAVGLFTSMLWPGTLILMEEKIVGVGVMAYAIMAAGGDLGASIAPQMLGAVADIVSSSSFAQAVGNTLNLSAEQVGLKMAMLIAALFPIAGAGLLIYMKKYFAKGKN